MSKQTADEYIRTYNGVCDHLVQITGLDRSASFSKLVDKSCAIDAVVRHFQSELKDYGRLRNAIVHYGSYPEEIIAEPREDALKRFQTLVATILSPKRVAPTFVRTVREFCRQELLKIVVTYMGANDFSQVVVRDGATLRLLTTEGIVRFVASGSGDGVADVKQACLADALTYDLPDNFEVVSTDCTIYEVRERFATCIERGKPRLDAILITHSGSDKDKTVGIATPWDMLTTGL